ncbi:T9SS type A sorting domain-containing protein [Algoriphagus chordae]|uniref:Uncharacterized protein n=1 Tax=Algoriphagus chordae TaxID=237019 RepID=A0A2W7QZP6_9BACT|nr:T9SS type A sorting domain-containing protein [Algoriphagus chordae]PZX52496.1 hypothetical protein LV85_01797 [Algoriphagus chordae]
MNPNLNYYFYNQLLCFLSFRLIKYPICLFLTFLISAHANAVDVVINGSTIVCPNNEITYTVNTYQIPFGWNVNTCGNYLWGIKKDGVLIDEIGGTTLTYIFEETGNYEVGVVASQCSPYFGGSASISVVSRVVQPNPISGPVMCYSGQSYSFTTSPSLASQYPYGTECFYHFDYLWTAPTGWSINGGGNTLLSPAETVGITAPINTPAGSYNISVEATIPNPAQSSTFYSTPRNFTVQIGSFSTSQVSVSGNSAVCNGNSYTYTANIPGGHKSGYTYNWTYPSGWNVESTSSNTIRLYVPSYNSSYGPVRVSVNNGCGSSGFTGLTVFPCNYMMSAGNFNIFPNPAQGELNVEYNENNNFQSNAESEQLEGEITHETKIFRIDILNHEGTIVKSGASKAGKIHLDISTVKRGSYFLHIYYNKEVIREQILIQ